jgi:dienelactone hydrolase
MRNETQDASPQIEIMPFATLVDEPVHIRATGFPAEQHVLLRAHLPTEFGGLESFALFQTDGTGCIDVARAVPLRGTYEVADPMGLFWSMTKVERTSSAVSAGLLGTVTLTAEVEGKVEASASCQRSWYVEASMTRVSVRERGLVGTFFHPRGSGPFPAVIVLGGGEGGLDVQECFAALLATHGYATLGLAYFGMEHLPPHLAEIPLDYGETALQWLQAQECVQDSNIGVIGGSAGGELALLMGAGFPAIRAVVGFAASGVIYQGIGPSSGSPRARWTYRGMPLPFVPFKEDLRYRLESRWKHLTGQPHIATPLYVASLHDPTLVDKATIPVEKIKGPVLLISGSNDLVWPSSFLSERVIQRLKQCGHPYPDQHLCYEGAGHAIHLPYLSTIGRTTALGGNPSRDAAASVDAWAHMLAFLEQNLRQ